MSDSLSQEDHWAVGLDALRRAITIAGSQQRVADAVGVGQSAISECLRNAQRVPAEWCIPLETLTASCGETIHCSEFRGDLWSARPSGSVAKTVASKTSHPERTPSRPLDSRPAKRLKARG